MGSNPTATAFGLSCDIVGRRCRGSGFLCAEMAGRSLHLARSHLGEPCGGEALCTRPWIRTPWALRVPTPMTALSAMFEMIACGRGGRAGMVNPCSQIVTVDTLRETDLTYQAERKCLSMMRKEASVVEAVSVSLRKFKARGRQR